MDDPRTGDHGHAQSQDTNITKIVEGNSAPVATGGDASFHDHGNKTIAILALIFGVSGTVLALAVLVMLYGLWNRQTLLQIFYNDIKTELIARGMNPHPHLPSESP